MSPSGQTALISPGFPCLLDEIEPLSYRMAQHLLDRSGVADMKRLVCLLMTTALLEGCNPPATGQPYLRINNGSNFTVMSMDLHRVTDGYAWYHELTNKLPPTFQHTNGFKLPDGPCLYNVTVNYLEGGMYERHNINLCENSGIVTVANPPGTNTYAQSDTPPTRSGGSQPSMSTVEDDDDNGVAMRSAMGALGGTLGRLAAPRSRTPTYVSPPPAPPPIAYVRPTPQLAAIPSPAVRPNYEVARAEPQYAPAPQVQQRPIATSVPRPFSGGNTSSSSYRSNGAPPGALSPSGLAALGADFERCVTLYDRGYVDIRPCGRI
jgi:hypothetical protein